MIVTLDDYDWEQVFALAGEAETRHRDESTFYANATSISPAPPQEKISLAAFGRPDVADIVWIEDGDNDGPDWLIGGTLKDGRWFFIAAGCDYTGWDCQSGGNAYVGSSREAIERFAMGESDRERLGVAL